MTPGLKRRAAICLTVIGLDVLALAACDGFLVGPSDPAREPYDKGGINCGNNVCSGKETCVSCPADCGPCADSAVDPDSVMAPEAQISPDMPIAPDTSPSVLDGGSFDVAVSPDAASADAGAPSDFGAPLKPSAATTGIQAGVTLTPHFGDLVITTPGIVLDALDIHGRVIVKAANVTIRRCRIRGKQTPPAPTEWNALVNAVSTSCSHLLVEECEIAPTYPSPATNGIQGRSFTSRRNNIHDVVDGLGMMGTSGCRSEYDYIHDLSYFSPDPNHSDNQTHNDCIQFHANPSTSPLWGNHVVIGSLLSAYVSSSSGTKNSPVPQALSCLMINRSVSLTVTNSWMEGGYFPVNGGDAKNAGLNLGTFWRNRFFGARADAPKFNKTPPFSIVLKSGSISDTGAGTANANRFYDGSEVLVRYY